MPSIWGFPGDSVVKNPPAMQEMKVRYLGQEDPLEEEMATHSSILARNISQTDEPGGTAVTSRQVVDEFFICNFAGLI